MAFDWAAAGSVLSGIGSIAGSGMFGGGGDGIDVSENYRLAQALGDAEADNIGKRVWAYKRAGKKEGFHPLWLMGKTPGSSPAVIAGQSNQGSKWGDTVSGVGNAIIGHEARKQAAQLHSAQTYKLAAEAAEAEARTDLMYRQYKDSLDSRNAAKSNHNQDLQERELVGPHGGKFRTSASTPQQVVEDEYGGIIGEGYGLYRGASDYTKALIRRRDSNRRSAREMNRRNYPDKYKTGGGY